MNNHMTIAIDFRVFNWTGIGRVARGLAYRLFKLLPEHHYIYILNPGQGEDLRADNVSKIVIHAKTFDFREHWQIRSQIVARKDIDLFHSLHFNIPLFLPKHIGLITNIYDLALTHFPDEARTPFHRFYYKTFVRLALARSDVIIAQSEYTSRDLAGVYRYERAHVIYPGFHTDHLTSRSDGENVRQKFNLPEHYILYVGLNKPRKNLRTLIAAYEMLVRDLDLRHVHLVIAGKMKNEAYDIFSDIAAKQMSGHVHLLGYVPDECLNALYSNAMIYACPSLLESGYSYPVLEAASFGLPILANRNDMETFGGDCLCYFDAGSTEDCAAKLKILIQNDEDRKHYAKKAKDLVERYTWDAYIRSLGDVYRKCASARHSTKFSKNTLRPGM